MLKYQTYDWHFHGAGWDEHIYDTMLVPSFIGKCEESHSKGQTIIETGSIGELWGLFRLEGNNAYYRRIDVLA